MVLACFSFPPREAAMSAQESDWKRLYRLVQSEKDPQKQKDLCERARRLIQERSIALAESNLRNAAEEDDLRAALRELWKLQNQQ